ncbi:MAG: flagellar hook assembly protein FlgD [Verrucomicrobia bacterium]|nr:flagellar hook assembly protein FlgD [Verrucomicrobiota bacterium]MCF7707901.1 flagellar hook assembly protein FlgD [Verrucomicrobiota bacterium]
MNISTTYNTYTGAAGQDAAPARGIGDTLSQQDFMKLLVTKLTTQDPLNPQSDMDFVAQMAQLSSLEQSKDVQSVVSELRKDQIFMSANSLLGRDVLLENDDGALITGNVSAVELQEGTPKLVINGLAYDLNQVKSVQMQQDQTIND